MVGVLVRAVSGLKVHPESRYFLMRVASVKAAQVCRSNPSAILSLRSVVSWCHPTAGFRQSVAVRGDQVADLVLLTSVLCYSCCRRLWEVAFSSEVPFEHLLAGRGLSVQPWLSL
jgi:hypothetical protein